MCGVADFPTVTPSAKELTPPSAGADGQVIVWNAVTGEQARSFRPGDWQMACVAFSPDGTTIAAGGTERAMYMWDAATGVQLATLAFG